MPLAEGTTTYSSSELGLVFLSPGGSATGPLCAALLGLPVLLAVVVGSLVGFLVVLVAMVGAPVLATGPAKRIKNVVCDVYESKTHSSYTAHGTYIIFQRTFADRCCSCVTTLLARDPAPCTTTTTTTRCITTAYTAAPVFASA